MALHIPEHFSPSFAGVAASLALLLILLLFRRIFFRYQAECWFCSEAVTVSYFKRNSFNCPHCEQYNGFTEDGDYNKPIPAMYFPFINKRRPHTEVPGGQVPGRHHLLCGACQSNQATKIKQLASFEPISEVTYDVEYRDFCDQQDELYQLCPPCQLRVSQEIERQDLILAPTVHYYRTQRKREEAQAGNWLGRCSYSLFLFIVRLTAVTAAVCLCAPDCLRLLGTEKRHYPKWIKHHDKHSLAITSLALLVLSILLSGKERFRKIDGIFLMLMLCVVVSPRVEDLPGIKESAFIYSRHILTPVCLATSVLWFIMPYVRLLKSEEKKRGPAPQISGLEPLLSSSGDEEADNESDSSGPPEAEDPGPSCSHGPVQNGINSLTLGPPRNIPKKQNDLWTSRIGNNTPPPPEMEGSRPVVHPARFNYASGSISGSAASSIVDGPTSSGPSYGVAQPNLRVFQAPPRPANKPDESDENLSADTSSDEGFSSISQRSVGKRRGRRRKRRRLRRWRDSIAAFFRSVLLPVIFGISVGLNLSAALYIHYSDR